MRLRSLALLLFSTVATYAHHSFVAEFDETKPVKMTGTVTKVEWQNPHIWFYVDVKGDDIVVEGFRSRDGSNNASGGKVSLPDGKNVFTAGGEDRVPDQGKETKR